jgi:Ca-activated chloride channel family protein
MLSTKRFTIRMLLSCLLVLGGTCSAFAAGLLTPSGSNLPALEIKEHKVKVIIEDGYAITTVEQVFHNPHATDLEAIYSFPVPEKGAVSEFTMWIDGTPIQGEVLEKEKARQVYEDQKAAGNAAGLTEKDSFKTFTISVSPVRAGQDTRIRLGYIQPAKVDSSIGHYVYPLEEGGVDEVKHSFWTANDKITTTFSFDLILRSSYPVDSVRLPKHPNAIIEKKGEEYHVHLGNNPSPMESGMQAEQHNNAEIVSAIQSTGSAFNLDEDIVVYYRHIDNLPGSVDLVTYKPEEAKRGTFMLTVTPAMDLKPINSGRDWIFILDISGSMQGKYNTLAEGVGQALEKMSANERFRIILFNNSSSELTRGYITASPENIKTYIDKVKQISPTGGTNVYDGLQLGLKKLDSDRTSAILLVTDGVANVGITRQKQFIELIRRHDVRLFTFIMGNSANRPLLTALTDASNGFAISVSNSDDIVGSILLAKSKVTHEALHGAKVQIKGLKTFDVNPAKIGSIYRGQQLIVFGHYYGGGEATVSLSGKISGEDKLYQTRFDFPEKSTANPEIERLWAYATIEQLSREMDNFGEDTDSKEAIGDIGMEYGLVTDYTSMVVVGDEVFQQLGIERNNKKRLQKEFTAQEQRAQSNTSSQRVDTAAPMFQQQQRPTTRNSGGGAGAIDPWAMLLLLPLVYLGCRKQD